MGDIAEVKIEKRKKIKMNMGTNKKRLNHTVSDWGCPNEHGMTR